MLTYSDLKNTYHTEKRTSSLTRINNNFYSEARKLLAQVDDPHKEHLTSILLEIYELRKNKIIINAARSHKPTNLIFAENELYDEIINQLKKFKNRLLTAEKTKKEVESKEEPKPEERKQEIISETSETRETVEILKTGKIKIRIIKNAPAIIGSDLAYYELKENTEIEMPEVDAKILIENGLAMGLQ